MWWARTWSNSIPNLANSFTSVTCALNESLESLIQVCPKYTMGSILQYKNSNVLGSSSIWTCRILNTYYYLLLFSSGRRSWKIQNKYSKFDASKSMSHQGHKTLKAKISEAGHVFLKGTLQLSSQIPTQKSVLKICLFFILLFIDNYIA